MFDYNCIVWVYKKVGNERQPVINFTMQMDREIDAFKAVVGWVKKHHGIDALENFSFKYETVEIEEQIWEGA